jgi:microcystin-dependent protein
MNYKKYFMKTLRFLTVLATLAFPYSLFAQVGINTTTPDSTAVLHVHHLTKGILLPTVSAAVRANIVSATDVANGLLVYDTLQKLYYYRDPESKNWIVLNPVRVSEQGTAPWGDVRLADSYRQRNMYIGADGAATAQAKLHVGGTLMADGAVTVKDGMDVTGNTSITGNMAVSSSLTVGTDITATAGTVTATNFVGYGTIPLGGIIMWSGTAIPDGWALCDGQTSNGYTTPDLRGKFVVGYNSSDSDYSSIGRTGGLKQVALSSSEQGAIKVRYRCDRADDSSEHGGLTGIEINGVNTYTQHVSPINENTDWLGFNTWQSTVATIPALAASSAHENRPPYYVLAFIMRVK